MAQRVRLEHFVRIVDALFRTEEFERFCGLDQEIGLMASSLNGDSVLLECKTEDMSIVRVVYIGTIGKTGSSQWRASSMNGNSLKRSWTSSSLNLRDPSTRQCSLREESWTWCLL